MLLREEGGKVTGKRKGRLEGKGGREAQGNIHPIPTGKIAGTYWKATGFRDPKEILAVKRSRYLNSGGGEGRNKRKHLKNQQNSACGLGATKERNFITPAKRLTLSIYEGKCPL